tara:strand:- start:1514 stop:1843 length:330 start_codon:yes stop_codon:yes gene_type:complete
MKKLFLLLFGLLFTINCYTQVTIKHFNADWNKSNKVVWLNKLTDCSVKYYDLTKYPKLKTKYKIVVLPTIILFVDGEEIKRYQANIMMQVDVKLETLQEAIDEAVMGGF